MQHPLLADSWHVYVEFFFFPLSLHALKPCTHTCTHTYTRTSLHLCTHRRIFAAHTHNTRTWLQACALHFYDNTHIHIHIHTHKHVWRKTQTHIHNTTLTEHKHSTNTAHIQHTRMHRCVYSISVRQKEKQKTFAVLTLTRRTSEVFFVQ